MRFVYGYVGNHRLPLPCCVYHKIRATFADEDKNYRGFEQEPDEDSEDESDEQETDNEQS